MRTNRPWGEGRDEDYSSLEGRGMRTTRPWREGRDENYSSLERGER